MIAIVPQNIRLIIVAPFKTRLRHISGSTHDIGPPKYADPAVSIGMINQDSIHNQNWLATRN